jgi:hypothetical protein
MTQERNLFRQELEKNKKETISKHQSTASTIPSIHPSSSSPIKKLLANYDLLNDDTKKEVLAAALTSNNIDFQRKVFSKKGLAKSDESTKQAKLAKELIKLANTYKVPELKFSDQASKRRSAYNAWVTKMRTILSMFPGTMNLFQQDTIIPFSDPDCAENKAVFLLISSKIDTYFLKAIMIHNGKGDKALELIKMQCANIEALDKHHFHHLFTTL